MSAERTHHELGYSKLDKLNACLHFLGKPAGPSAKRGTDKHDSVEVIMRGGVSYDEVSQNAAKRIKSHVPKVLSIEEKLPLVIAFEEISYGYADYVGRGADGKLVVVDLKTGSQPPESYRLQLTALALAAMDKYDEQTARCVLVYADSEDDYTFEVVREEAEEQIAALYERIARKQNEAPAECQYCSWCARKAECPVWVKPIKTIVAMDEAADIADAGFSKEAILASPETAARFWNAYKKFTSVVDEWEVDGKIKEWIAAGTDVPGFKTQTRKGRQSIDAEKFLATVLKGMGIAKVAEFITVSPKVIQAWAKFTTEPFPVEVTEGESTVSLVAIKGGK